LFFLLEEIDDSFFQLVFICRRYI